MSPGSGTDKPPYLANHRLQAQLLYSPRNNSKLRPNVPKGNRVSKSPKNRFDLKQLVNQKERKADRQKDKVAEKVWLELNDEEVTGVFYGDRELLDCLHSRGLLHGRGSPNADLDELPGLSRVRFSDDKVTSSSKVVHPAKKPSPFGIGDDGESSDEAAIAQEKDDSMRQLVATAGKNESLRKKQIQSSPPVVANSAAAADQQHIETFGQYSKSRGRVKF